MAKYYKLVVFIPLKSLETVRKAICGAGAGKIGNHYDNCAFYSIGTGSFRPKKGANPHIGKIGKTEKAREARLETIVAKKNIKPVVSALLRAHPYEEPAYDIYPLIKL